MTGQLAQYWDQSFGRLIAFLPNLIGGVIILAVGYFISRGLGVLCRKGLERTRFDGFVSKHLHPRAKSPSAGVGAAVFWLGLLATLSFAADALGIASLSGGIHQIIAFVPRVFVAAVLLGVAWGLANFVVGLIPTSTVPWMPRAVKAAIVTLGVFMALDEIGVARAIVNTAFTAMIGAAAVAFALAFGIGGQDIARQYLARWRRESLREGRVEHEEERRPPEIPLSH
jgi:hypothetical protein